MAYEGGIAYLYKNGINYKKKCLDEASYLAYKNWSNDNGNTRSTQITGCYVSNSTGYFDFILSTAILPSELEAYSFAEVGGANDVRYAVIIERYELNNFSYQEKGTNIHYPLSYRAYFTVDWWTTNLTRGNPPIKVRGAVSRGHLCDLTYGQVDNGVTVLRPVYSYLTFTQEYSSNYERVEKRAINFPSSTRVSPKTKWLYVLIADASLKINQQHIFDGYDLPCSYVVLPLFVSNGTVSTMRTMLDGNFTDGLNDNNTWCHLEDISDERIVGMFYSSIPPSDYTIFTFGILKYATPKYPIGNYSVVTLRTKNGDMSCLAPLNIGSFSFHKYLNGEIPCDTYRRFDNYSSYKASSVKINCFPYRVITINVGGSEFPYYPYLSDSNNLLYIGLDYNSGGVIIKHRTQLTGDLTDTYILQSDNMFTTAYSQGQFNDAKIAAAQNSIALTNTKSSSYAIEKLKRITSNSIGTVKGIIGSSAPNPIISEYSSLSAIESGANIAFELVSTPIELEALEAQIGVDYNNNFCNLITSQRAYSGGSLGTTANAFLSNGDIGITIRRYVYTNTILHKMALYGYDTTLTAEEILAINSPHLRECFNYIQTAGCFIDSTLTAEATAQIKSLFDGGVWLFNKYSFNNQLQHGQGFSLECVNYPLGCYTPEEKGE